MKPMEYKKRRQLDTLATGTYKGFRYWILSLGTHPVAYVEVPETHKLYGTHYNYCPIECHYGMTYSEDHLVFLEYSEKYKCDVRTSVRNTWIIGWDYAYSGDWYGRYSIMRNDKKWTTEEIYEEVKQVIEQLEELK